MKTLTLTQARQQLGELMHAAEPVKLTRRGQPIGTLHVEAQAEPAHDRDRAMAAARRLREIGMTRKPSKTHGGAKAVRKLRDDGR